MSKAEEIDPRAKYVAALYLAMFADKHTRVAAIKMAEHNRQKHGSAVWGAALEQASIDLAAAAEMAGSLQIAPLSPIRIGGHDLYPMGAS